MDDDNTRISSFLSKISPDVAHWRKTAQGTIRLLHEFNHWDWVFLDHDLGGEQMVNSNREDCGMEVVRWIVENQPSIDNILVHSWNSPAGKEMVAKLKDAGYNAEYKPFGLW